MEEWTEEAAAPAFGFVEALVFFFFVLEVALGWRALAPFPFCRFEAVPLVLQGFELLALLLV